MPVVYRRQMVLAPTLKSRLSHGGEIRRGKRKLARPVATKRPMHLVLKATAARGGWSFLTRKNSAIVRDLISRHSERWQVRVYEQANSGNHLHLLVRARTREGFRGFLRALPGAIAMAVTGARKGSPLGKRFWDLLAFSRVVEWGGAYSIALRYVVGNREGMGDRGGARPGG